MNKGAVLYQPNGSMFSYPTPTFDFDVQSQPQDTFHNKQVANYSWAVQGGLSALNTNVQGGYPSESPLPMSSSTNGHSNYPYDLGFINPANFSTQTSYSEDFPCPNTQDGTSSQALVPRSRKEANEALIKKLRACIWLFLKTKRLRLRTLRRKGGRRRYSASSCPSWTTGTYNVSQQVPPLGLSFSSDDTDLYGLAIEDQDNQFHSLDPSSSAWWGNALGIFPSDQNPPFLVPADAPRQATVLSEEEITPTTVRAPVACLNEPALSEIETDQFGQRVPTSNRSGKRPIDCVDPEDSPIDEVSHISKKKNQSKKTSPSPQFACPFYKHDPERYTTSRSCCGPGWKSVHRVKEHVFRKHKLPEHECHRCFEAFATGEVLSEHLRASVLCKVQSRDSQGQKEGINASQCTQLHARAKKIGTGSPQKKVEEERWDEVYRIIFPGEEVPTPYYNHLQDPSNDDFERKIMANFDKRILLKLQYMNMQTSLTTEVAKVARSALWETIQFCRQASEDSGSPNSQLTTSWSQDTQSFPGMESQFPDISGDLFFSELVARSLVDPSIGFNNTSFGTFP